LSGLEKTQDFLFDGKPLDTSNYLKKDVQTAAAPELDDAPQQETPEEAPTPTPKTAATYYPISETAARRAKE